MVSHFSTDSLEISGEESFTIVDNGSNMMVEYSFPVSDYNPGLYLVEINTSDGIVKLKLI